jgi:hypothetical protein
MELLALVAYVVMAILVALKLSDDIAKYAGQEVIDEKGGRIALMILVMGIVWPISIIVVFFNPIQSVVVKDGKE